MAATTRNGDLYCRIRICDDIPTVALLGSGFELPVELHTKSATVFAFPHNPNSPKFQSLHQATRSPSLNAAQEMKMNAIGHKWAAAAFSGYAIPKHWQKWADAKIEKCEVPENWLITMSLARSYDELEQAIVNRLRKEELEYGGRIYIGNAKLGYLYWMFCERRFTFADFLNAAGSEADGGTGNLECEIVYAIHNELERRIGAGERYDDLIHRADALFKPYLSLAQSEWAEVWDDVSPPDA